MVREAIGTAPTLDEARSKAIAQLDAPLDADVIVEVLEQATKKTFGLFGGSPAKVRAYYEIPDEKPVKTEKAKQETNKKETVSRESAKQEDRPQPKKEFSKKQYSSEQPSAKEAPKPEAVQETVPEAPKGVIVSSDNAPANYLKSILAGMGFDKISIVTRETEEEIFLEIVSEDDYGNIIGRRGETLDAIQYLVRLSVNRIENEERRVTLNIGDYRNKREDTLKSLAKRQASRVIKYGRNAVLDPMNPYERRIIHTTVQGLDGVESHSIGEGEGRRVVITPTGGRTYGGFDKGARGANRGRGRNDGKPQYKPQPRENREPKADFEGEFHFGKIEPKTKNE